MKTESIIPEAHAGAILTIDLTAIRANYRLLCERLGGADCAAVVKADGYGLGATQVSAALYREGARDFFVAHLEEGVSLRKSLSDDAKIHVFNGLLNTVAGVYQEHRLIPVLNSLANIIDWQTHCGDTPLPCDIHVDTGMLRLGLPQSELSEIKDNPALIRQLDIGNVISHLASADELGSDQSAQQLSRFREARKIIPQGRASLANSSGIFLGPDYHQDLARPGAALYGVSPNADHPQALNPVVNLKSRILQVRDANVGEVVGYGATHTVNTPSRIATLAVGYADGYLRSLSGRGTVHIGETKVPLIGRVSMDMISVDVSTVPDNLCQPGMWVELIGAKNSVDDLAKAGDTIGYEILTSLGNRYHRVYTTS